MNDRASTPPSPSQTELNPPPDARLAPISALIGVLILAVNVAIISSSGPDEALLRDLRRSTARVEATSVTCVRGGRGPRATIVIDGRYFECGGVECDARDTTARPMIRYDARNPGRCRAEASLEGESTWESTQTGGAIIGALIAFIFLVGAAVRFLRQRAVRRAFYASKEWREYIAQRDGEEG